MFKAEHVSIYIDCPLDEVYDYAANPENLPQWAAGLARSEVKRSGDSWVADSPFGKVTIRFSPRNALGVMDHDVEMDTGETVHNPMRVIPNGDGCEFIFSILKRPGMSEQQFREDVQAVEKDLYKLKTNLERTS